jgi:DNA-binding transcriptional MerR regulator
MMNPTTLAKLLNVDPVTMRRWTVRYAPYLSPNASPAKGKTRTFTHDDVRVLHYIGALRDAGTQLDEIEERLKEMQENDWIDLPHIPAEWETSDETMPVTEAASRAYQLAQVAILQKELEHTKNALQVAQNRLVELETRLASKAALETEKHALELELVETKGEVEQLKAELKAYGMAYSIGTSGSKPLSAVTLVGLVAIITVLLVIIIATITVLIT